MHADTINGGARARVCVLVYSTHTFRTIPLLGRAPTWLNFKSIPSPAADNEMQQFYFEQFKSTVKKWKRFGKENVFLYQMKYDVSVLSRGEIYWIITKILLVTTKKR